MRTLWFLGLVALVQGACDGAGPAPAAVPAPPVQEGGALPPRIELQVGAFSASSEAIGVRILPRFAAQWRRSRGEEIGFVQRFEGSGALVDAIRAGFAADVAVLAMAADMQQLVRAGLVADDWMTQPHGGIVCRSLIAFAVRKDNPKAIRRWADLLRPDIRIVCADPASSGCGVWSACAIYGAALRGHAGVPAGDPAAARRFLAQVWGHVVASGGSAAEAYAAFRSGSGDVAITYESEIARSWLFGGSEDRVVPDCTLLVESPAAVVRRHADLHGVRAAADALVRFLWTPAMQQKFAVCGLRPVDPDVLAANAAQFPVPADLWSIDALGGWERAVRDVLEPAGFAVPPGTPGK